MFKWQLLHFLCAVTLSTHVAILCLDFLSSSGYEVCMRDILKVMLASDQVLVGPVDPAHLGSTVAPAKPK